MATTIVYLIVEQARAAEAAKVEPQSVKNVHLTSLRTGIFGQAAARRAITALEAAGGHFYWRHAIEGVLRTSYFGVDITGPANCVDAVLAAMGS